MEYVLIVRLNIDNSETVKSGLTLTLISKCGLVLDYSRPNIMWPLVKSMEME